MAGADWILLFLLGNALVVGYRRWYLPWMTTALGFTVGVLLGELPSARFGRWVYETALRRHASFQTAVDVRAVMQYLALMLMGLAVVVVVRRVSRVARPYWSEVVGFPAFSKSARIVSAVNAGLIVVLVSTELALLFAGTMRSTEVARSVLNSSIVYPTARLFHLVVP